MSRQGLAQVDPMDDAPAGNGVSFLSGGGETGASMRALDWSSTPIGPPASWPPELRMAAGIVPGARAAMSIHWGPDLILLYNDAWGALIGDKHPDALGRPFRDVFPEVWATVGPMLTDVLAGHGARGCEDRPFPLDRHRRVEGAGFDGDHTPIPLADGSVGGVLNIAAETSARVNGERIGRFRGLLDERLRDLSGPDAVMAAAAELLGRHLSVDRAGYAEIEPPGDIVSVGADWCAEGMPSLAGRHRLDDFGPALIAEFRAGRTVAFPDALEGVLTGGDVAAQAFAAAHPRAAITVPLVRDGRFAAALYVHCSNPREWTSLDVALVRDVAERTWAAVEQARVEAALRESEARFRNMADHAPVMMWVTDPSGSCTYLNRRWYAFTGQTAGEAEGLGWLEATHPDDKAATEAAFVAANAARAAFRIEYRLRRADGTYRWSIDAAAPRFGADGEWLGYIGSVIDIDERKEAEDALRASERELHRLADSLPLLVNSVDRNECYQFVNKTYEDWFGRKIEDMRGRRVREIVGEAAYATLEGPIARALSGERFAFEQTVPYRDGGPRHVKVEFVPRMSPDEGDVDGYYAVIQDIGERKRAEDALRELNADLERQVVERSRERGLTWQVSPDLLSVMNPAGFFENTNPAWQAVLGWSADELASVHYTTLVHPDDVAPSQRAFEEITRGDPVLRFENRYRRSEGGYRWLSWTAVPEGGRFYCSARDVTAQKEQSDALAARTAERDRLWRNSQDILVVIDTRGVFRAANPAVTRILGWAPEEMLGLTVFDFIVPEDHAATIGALTLAATDQLPIFENRYRHKDGGCRWLSWVAAPEGDLIYATARHVTAEKEQAEALHKTEEALRQAQKMEAVGQLTGGVAHDFNNLLTVIKSSTDLLKRSDLPEERRRRYVEAISDTVDRAAKLTGQLLAFARRQALQPKVFDVGQSVRSVNEMLSTLTGSRIRIVLELSEEPCFIDADPSQFDTALVNMAVNARDAMDGEGIVLLSVRAVPGVPALRTNPALTGDYVAVSLSDTGVGIPSADLERIFEPFFTTKGVGQGTGLGLSQVFGFAKQSNGDVSVESELGRGTTFTLYLPRVGGEGEAIEAVDAEPLVDGNGACVLVVEDNVDVGTFATQALAELGYRTVWSINADDALAELSRDADRFDVVFSDVVMPGMNGIDLAKEIRRLYPDLPVVLTSGYSHVLAQNGTDGFDLLHKPYSVDLLSRILGKAPIGRRGTPTV